MKRILLLLAAAAAAMVLVGCSSSDSTTATSSSSSSGGTTPMLTAESGAMVSADGSWVFACVGGPGSNNGTDTFTGASFSATENDYYTATDCTGTTFYTEVIGGTWTVVGTTTAAFGAGTVTANQVTFTLTSATSTPNDSTMAGVMNSGVEYGFPDWASGVTKDILAALTAFIGGATVNFLIYLDDTVTPNRMYWDDVDPPMTSGFPTTVLNTDFSEKQ